ncbi:Uncharacterized protein APZ42_011165 [Daphnia magna]|uniref:Uncharacterized protein n=1 Tax=Daphnia magna TaxID=35525 RepID=A0A162T207_9CRUS|nr:Uncharacterized protein APZ42_011165 [Daphnia magna]
MKCILPSLIKPSWDIQYPPLVFEQPPFLVLFLTWALTATRVLFGRIDEREKSGMLMNILFIVQQGTGYLLHIAKNFYHL